MPGTTPDSSVLEFYNDAKIFITGGTGFLGKALIEKFLRSCPNVNHIYLLIRTKKGKDPHSRLKAIFEDPLFQILRKEKPDFDKKITCIPGDVACERLSMSDNDYEFLVREVTHVFHSAATVRFNEKIKTAVYINVLGTREMLEFCKKCIRLKVFAHVSTAYSNCIRDIITEDYYDPPIKPDSAIEFVQFLNEDKLNSITDELIKPWPNTYTYTKAIAENLIKEQAGSIPTLVFRPGIVMGTFKEPVVGWIDNIYGPTGIITAVGVGLLRVLLVDENQRANILPVDLSVNALISSAWEVGSNFNNNSTVESSLTESADSTGPSKMVKTAPKVYNFVTDDSNYVTWRKFSNMSLKYGRRIPSERALWYYTLTFTRVKFLFLLLTLLLHYIPGGIVDGLCILLGKKPQLCKAYQKIYQFTNLMTFFSTKNWKFDYDNTKQLYSHLNDADKEIFEFDVSKLDWDLYFSRILLGIRRYILRENDSTLPYARRKMFLLWLGHRALQFSCVLLSFWILSKFLFTYEDLKTHFKEPIVKHSGILRNST